MDVGKIAEFSNPLPATTPKSTVEQTAKKETTTSTDNPNTDKFVKEDSYTYTPAYTKASSKSQSEGATEKDSGGIAIQKAKSTVALKNESFSKMVSDIIGKQSGLAYDAIIKDASKIQNGTIDDYWSADSTAQRIFDFAQSLAGDDTSKIEELRSAVQEGFRQAGAKIGKDGSISGLPSICGDTYSKVMSMFDDWANGKTDKTAETSEEE